MGPRDALLAPLHAAGAVARAADNLHTLAERARREPDPVDEARERLDRLSAQLDALIVLARGLSDTSQTIVTGGQDLQQSAEALESRNARSSTAARS